MIDEINDVLNYTHTHYQSSGSGGMALINNIEHAIEGIYALPNTPDGLFFDINKLTDIDALLKKVS
jgi:hypothetical protein